MDPIATVNSRPAGVLCATLVPDTDGDAPLFGHEVQQSCPVLKGLQREPGEEQGQAEDAEALSGQRVGPPLDVRADGCDDRADCGDDTPDLESEPHAANPLLGQAACHGCRDPDRGATRARR